MSYFIIFVVTLLFSLSLAVLGKRSFARSAATGNFILIFILYTAGLFKRLDAGVYAYIAVAAALTVIAAVSSAKRKDGAWKKLLKEPLFIFYAFTGIALGIMFINKISTDYDEMTHWALVVKNMFAYDNFGNLGDTTTMFNRYVPATGIFMYAFQIFNPEFINGHLYAAFDMLMISMLLIVPDRYGQKLSFGFFATLIIMLGIPVLFKINVYRNLLVDGILAVMTAYIYFAYLSDRGKANAWTVADVALGCFVILLTKSSGLPLAIFALVFIAVDVLTRGRKFIKGFFGKKSNVIALCFVVLAIVYAKVSWNMYSEINDTRAGWDSSEMTFGAIIEFFRSPNEFQSAVADKFVNTFFIGKFFYEYGAYLQQPNLFVIGVFAAVAAIVCVRSKKVSYGIGMFAFTLIFILSYGFYMLLMYLFSFSYAESLRLASYPRYFGTLVSALALIWCGITADVFLNPETARKKVGNTAVKARPEFWAIPATVLSVGLVAATLFGNAYFVKERAKFTAGYEEWIEAVSELEDTDRVYYAMRDFGYKGTCVREYIRIRFYATPTRCSGFTEGGSYAQGRGAPSAFTGNPFEMNKTSAEQLAEILTEYDYFFIDDADEAFKVKYGGLFDGEIKSKVMYRVTVTGSGVILSVKTE